MMRKPTLASSYLIGKIHLKPGIPRSLPYTSYQLVSCMIWPSAKGHGVLDLTMNNMPTRLRTQECLSWSTSSWVSLWLSHSLVTNLVTNIGDPWFFRCFCCQIALARRVSPWVTQKQGLMRVKFSYPGIIPEIVPRKHPGVFFSNWPFPTNHQTSQGKNPCEIIPKRVNCLVKLKTGKVVGIPLKGWYSFFPLVR